MSGYVTLGTRRQPMAKRGKRRDGERDVEGDRRDIAGDERDLAGDRRDIAANDRDLAGDSRDVDGDQRDLEGDDRDVAGEERDDAGGRRDVAGRARDAAAARRDDRDEQTERNAMTTAAASINAAVARRDAAASDRRRASEDRRAGAVERSAASLDRRRAEADRGASSRDRAAGASERWRAGGDRTNASTDRSTSAVDRERASFDGLTGVYLRDAGLVEMHREIGRARRTSQTLIAAFVDVDSLKRVNDTGGHSAGDRLLVEVAHTLRAKMRPYDLVIRRGGDEFVCALSGMSHDDAAARFDQVNAALATGPVVGSVTVGLAELEADDTVEDLLARADAALYSRRQQERGAPLHPLTS